MNVTSNSSPDMIGAAAASSESPSRPPKGSHARILIVTSCTGRKAVRSDHALTLADFRRGPAVVATREAELADLLMPAEDLYTGQQHARLMRGVHTIRHRRSDISIDLRIVSAGYGLVSGHRRIAPYEATFDSLSSVQASRWADSLGLPEAVRAAVEEPFDLALVLLGNSYLRAARLPTDLTPGGPIIMLCSATTASKIPKCDRVRPVVLTKDDTRRFNCGFVGLKGEVAGRLLERLAREPEFLAHCLDPAFDLLRELGGLCENRVRSRRTPQPNVAVDRIIDIPERWWNKSQRARLRYFIPDWDDLVDSQYDFATDTHSAGVGDWSNEVFAHQIYPEPCYDGILVSRSVLDRSLAKHQRVVKLGIHRFLRVPDRFNVMGDCGAFGYITAEEPPYTTDEILDYYTTLGFNIGVSIDHIIIGGSDVERRRRHALTIHNAEAFLREHNARGLGWTAIGAVQGWDPASYANAARSCVAMGYDYIGLGGLVRSRTPEILAIVEEVRAVIPHEVLIHLFGIARLEAVSSFLQLGISSIDSASPLRRAWLDARNNYLTCDGWYTAVRVPYSSSAKAKRLVTAGTVSAERLVELEAACLGGLRAYAEQPHDHLSALLDTLEEYNALLSSKERIKRERIEKTLLDRPWEQCDCTICRRWGIEVVIFRGNNRNRRRGFHNTFVFHQLLQRIIEGECIEWLSPPNSARQLRFIEVDNQ